MYYEYGNSNLDGIETVFVAAGAGFLSILLFFVLVVGLVFYVFESIGLYTLAKRRGLQYPGLAWVPVANMWILGSLADNYMNVTELRETKSRYILLSLEIIRMVIAIPMVVFAVISSLETIVAILDERYYAAGDYVFNIFWILGLSFLFSVLSITLMVFLYISLYRIFKSCQPSNAVLYLILSILVGSSLPFILFAIRNKDEGMIPAYVNPPYGEESLS